MNAPRLTVIMPVFNAAAYLREAIGSVLGQTFRDFELIIIDDGSTDGSRKIAQSFGDRRISILCNPRNMGAAAAKNHGIENARGEFLAFLDADDIALPHRFETQLAFFALRPEIGLIGTSMDVITTDGVVGERYTLEEKSPFRLKAKLLFHNPIAQSSVMLMRDGLAGEMFRGALEPAEDYDLWVRLSKSVPMVVLGEVLVQYRIHPQSASTRREVQMEESVAGIVLEQLSQLQISVSEDELRMHRRISAGISSSDESLLQARAWLDALREANARLLIYNPGALDEVLAGQWAHFLKTRENDRRSRAPWRRLMRRLGMG